MTENRMAGRSSRAAVVLACAVAVLFPSAAAGQPTGVTAAGPAVGPEIPVARPAPGTPRIGFDPSVAYGGGVHLVVWDGVSAGRVDRFGTVLDPSRIVLPDGSDPAVAFDGENFLVIWRTGGGGIEGRRVSPDGRVLDASSIVITDEGGDEATVTFGGSGFLVAWPTDEGIAGALVDTSGTVVAPAHLLVATQVAGRIDVAFNGTHHLVVWDRLFEGGYSRIFSSLVTPEGTVLDPLGVPVAAPSARMPTVAAVGTSFFVAWLNSEEGTVSGVWVNERGAVVSTDEILLNPTWGGSDDPEVGSDGTSAFVTWHVSEKYLSAIYGVRVDRSGEIRQGLRVFADGADPTLVFDGTNYLVVASGGNAIRATRMTTDAAVLDPEGFVVSLGANAQTDVDMALGRTESLIVWTDDRTQAPTIHGARVGPDGQILDGTGIAIGPGVEASVAFDGTNYLVVWLAPMEQGGGPDYEYRPAAIRAARVSRVGEVLDRFDVHRGALVEGLFTPRVAYGAGTFLVTWSSALDRGQGWVTELRAARVGEDGVVADPGGMVVSVLSGVRGSDLVYGASQFLVVWSDATGDGWNIHATSVTVAGRVAGPTLVSAGRGHQVDPQVAWNGTHHLVVWTDWGLDQQRQPWSNIVGARVDGAGVVLDPTGIAVSTAPGAQRNPTVAANGPFLVTWTDRRRAGDDDADQFATEVTSDGTVAQPDGFTVATSVGEVRGSGAPVTAAPGTGSFAVGYQRFVAERPYDTERAFLRWISPHEVH